MGYKLAIFLGLSGFLMVLMVDQADSACCHAVDVCSGWWYSKDCSKKCRDGTQPTPYCGHGRCNIFGCACSGGCRGGCKRSVADSEEARSLLELLEGENAMSGRGYEGHDADAELKVAQEARGLLEMLRGEQENLSPGEGARPAREFGHHDVNQDLKLSKEEALEILKKNKEVDINNLPDDWFTSLDKNGNGYIDPEEYDPEMAKHLE